MVSNFDVSDNQTFFSESVEYDAIIPNHGDHAYCVVAFDPNTMTYFIKNLYKIEDYLDRTIVWRHLPFLFNLGLITLDTYFSLVNSQLWREPVEQNVIAVIEFSDML